MNLPLISCIMPTKNRREFVPKAIEFFSRQTYPNKELVIANDAEEGLLDLIPDTTNVSYFRTNPFLTLGRKRNVCCKAANGDLIAIFDDDDQYDPERLALQVTAMQDANAEVCGIDAPIFYDLITGLAYQYHYRGPGCYLYSATLMFTRDYWERSPFPDLQVGASTPFVCGPGRLDRAAFMSPDWYTGISHLENNSPKMFKAREFTRWEGDVKSRLGADWSFYQSLRP